MFKDNLIKTLIVLGILGTSILIMETVFRYGTLNLNLSLNYFRVASFSFFYAAFLVLFIKFLKPRHAKNAFFVILIILSIFYFAQNLFYNVSEGFFTVRMIRNARAGADFLTIIVRSLSLVHLLYIMPVVVCIMLLKESKWFSKLFDFRYENYRVPIYMTLFTLTLMVLSIQTISSAPLVEDDDFYYSERDFYQENFSPHHSVNRFGLLTYTRRDIQNIFRDVDREEPTKDEQLETFFNNRDEPSSNYMTNRFKDKNVIFIKAESLDTYSVDPDFMPNYSEMLDDNSMVFDNFYAPLYSRNTSDSEFMTFTSFYPTQVVNTSMASYYDNTFPNTIPQMFNDKGFNSIAHHNYTDHYYPRNDFHPSIGFDAYNDAYAMGMLEEGEYEGSQPPWMSDLEMFEHTLDDVISDEPFFAYYLTVSGHLPYDDTHETASEHYDRIIEIYEENDREIPEDESIIYHHAAHYDFDLALGYLMDTLEEKDLLDDTVIWIQSDHYAYGMSRDTIGEIDDWKNINETRLNIHNVPLSIHHPSLDGRTVSHTFSNIDVMPTIANMFGLDFNHKYALGYDVFDRKTENTVFFLDSSFMTDTYFMAVNEDMNIVKRTGSISGEGIDQRYNQLIHKRQMNQYFLETNYYQRLIDDETLED